jgi:hypothetical protein
MANENGIAFIAIELAIGFNNQVVATENRSTL